MAGMAKVNEAMTEKMPKAMTTAQTVRVGAFKTLTHSTGAAARPPSSACQAAPTCSA